MKRDGRRKRGIAAALAAMMMAMAVAPNLPTDFVSWAGDYFHLTFRNSGTAGHPDLLAEVPGDSRAYGMFCLNEGASAKSGYLYYKTDQVVNYSEGSLEDKRMFWAYILTYGSADKDTSLKKRFGTPLAADTMTGKRVAWSKGASNGGSKMIEDYAHDGFMSLERIPPGCKTPENIFELVSKYDKPENAMWMGEVLSAPGVISGEKLYEMCGISDFPTFQKYCQITPVNVPEGMVVQIMYQDSNIITRLTDTAGVAVAGGGPITLKVTYDPHVFKVSEVKGTLEFFQCDEAGSQQLYRARGSIREASPVFYMTNRYNPNSQIPGGSSSGGGSRGDGGGIIYRTYRHQETFEGNYKVGLKKYDYETGLPLEGSVWQVLECFPDQGKLKNNESDGNLTEGNMRGDPATWDGWMVFEDDLVTDGDGSVSYQDTRYYEFAHTYCNGHPLPPEPEEDGEGEEDDGGDDEYEQLMEEWQEKVDECEARASSGSGTMHHWLCGSESEPTEAEAFTGSGCEAARDAAYQNFIGLRYSYTFRETEPRDGYIIHGANGHPDDVPIEIITTASSEAGEKYEWTEVDNGSIAVEGYVRNRPADMEAGAEEAAGYQPARSLGHHREERGEDGRNLYLTEDYSLSMGQRTVNALRQFLGLPEQFASEKRYTVQIAAKDHELPASPSDWDESGDGEEPSEIPLIDDITPEVPTATGSDALMVGRSTNLALHRTGHVATWSDAAYSYSGQEDGETREAAALFLEEDEEDDSAVLDSQPGVEEGPHGNTAHTFAIYDHRVPGQIHFNKRDMDLEAGENGSYVSYGDTQGDATLEGAVYGLFAADDIYGPDTRRGENGEAIAGTGIIFDANDLVAVAATDKNGDGSFLAITEKPHSTYSYKTGQIEYSGKGYPKNLYDADVYRKANPHEETGRAYMDCLRENGDYWIGRPLILGNYYIKELARPECYELSVTGRDMEMTNAAGEARDGYGETDSAKSHPVGKAWVSSQLKHAVTFPEGNAAFGNRENLFDLEVKSYEAEKGFDVIFDGLPEGADFYCNQTVASPVKIRVPIGGHWVEVKEEPLYETADSSGICKKDADGRSIEDPDAVRDIPVPYDGYAYKINLLDAGGTASVSDPEKYGAPFAIENADYIKYELETMMRQIGMETPKDAESGRYSTEGAPVYDRAGKGTYGSPEIILEISDVTTNGSLVEAILDYYLGERIFTYGSLQDIEIDGDTVRVTAAAGASPSKNFLYEEDSAGNVTAAYLYKPDGDTGRYVMRRYAVPNLAVLCKYPGNRRRLQVSPDFHVGDGGMPVDELTYASPLDQYLRYEAGDVLYDYWYKDGSGNWIGHEPVRRMEYETIFEDRDIMEESLETSKVAMVPSNGEVADPVGSTYVYYDADAEQYILHMGTAGTNLTGARTFNFTVAIPDGSIKVTAADIEKIGENNVWGIKEGDSLGNSEYIRRISGAGAGVYTGTVFDQATTFIRNQGLIYNGSHDLREDGNTDVRPVKVQERIISQKIKVTKTVEEISYNNTSSYAETHGDWWTKLFGGFAGKGSAARKVPGFRFKIYLKSNLARIYRDGDGNITWQDKKGNEIGILEANRQYPARAARMDTKVLHETGPLYQDSENAIVANTMLYGYTDGYINEDQNPGYTAVLETAGRLAEDGTGTRIVKAYNYDKFFDAIAVANHDKWDDQAPTYTSWQPIGNAANRTEDAIENAKASDLVRQFAIDWYLDDEAAKLIDKVPGGLEGPGSPEGSGGLKGSGSPEGSGGLKGSGSPGGSGSLEDPGSPEGRMNQGGTVRYTDELYDEALRHAIQKAENYLKPFFAYDLDEIYAVEWDGEADGGNDRDASTLSADRLSGDTADSGPGYYFGISAYLPYGTYVIAEQQPKYAALQDFKNRHYQIDKPREVEVPEAYASYDGSQSSPEELNRYYNYDPAITPPEMERKYKIRFREEPVHLIKGRNADGDFEVYKYGLAIGDIKNGVTDGAAGDGSYYALSQDALKPYKNYYNPQDDRAAGEVPYYLSEGLSGREAVGKYYRYSSVAEKGGTADDVPYPGGTVTEDNVPGTRYQDGVTIMHGVQTAYDGKYASMLVPWSITAPADAAAEAAETRPQASGEGTYKGFAYSKFRNRLYTAKLRIEKLDSETHENILHDGALFHIYAAKRDDSGDGNGNVLFYETDTTVTGTKEFLESMCADRITPVARRLGWLDRLTGKEYGPGNLYSGVVPAGTPICREEEQITLGDRFGVQTVAFKGYSTVLDGQMEDAAAGLPWQLQTVGYLETPQPLSAGCYVICEAKAPAGYARSKPVALEIYSDQVAYYKEGRRDGRVLAARYSYESDNRTENGTKPQDVVNLARVNVENQPIRLQAEKLKESSAASANTTADKTVTYKVSGRIDGKLADIGNSPDYVYAYENGDYLGYAWKKGTLEYLKSRQDAGEQVEIIYEGRNFAGYGYVTRPLETADDANGYVAGAVMTLFDALELKPSGDSEDYAYEGLAIERSGSNNITRMYVKEGYAGKKTDFIKEKDENGQEITVRYQAGVDKNGNPVMAEGNIWDSAEVQRPDTDILFYDLDSLAVTVTEHVDGKDILYGYSRDYRKVPLGQMEADKVNIERTDTEHSIFAFKGGMPYLEFVGGDFTRISYSPVDKVLEVGVGTLVYHLDRDGNRDSLVDPYTGMAYVNAGFPGREGRVLVWPVRIHRDGYGNIIARDKITTSRIATVGENQDGYREDATLDVTDNSGHGIPAAGRPSYHHTESGYITGSWKPEPGEAESPNSSPTARSAAPPASSSPATRSAAPSAGFSPAARSAALPSGSSPATPSSGPVNGSHRESSLIKNRFSQNLNNEVLTGSNNGSFPKELSPVYDSHGLAVYYRTGGKTYGKSTDLYDRDGDFVRQQDSDHLGEYNGAAYRIESDGVLYDGDEAKEGQTRGNLYHRLGEGYILENTWVTSDKTPNDPFHTQQAEGQPDMLKRVPAGTYIMEELKAPAGYLKGMPAGVSVQAVPSVQHVGMVDKTTKVVIDKVDGAGHNTAGLGAYSYGRVAGAELALYEARRVYTSDTGKYPKGYYLEKTGTRPLEYHSTESTAKNEKKLTAKWTTGDSTVYLEGIPQGTYLLEELRTPTGFVTSNPAEVEITNTPEVQVFTMYDDHTKIEVEKYTEEGTGRLPVNGAEFTLYEAKTDGGGNVLYDGGKAQYYEEKAIEAWTTGDMSGYRGFLDAFEDMYRQYGTRKGTAITWADADGTVRSASYESCEQIDASVNGGGSSIHPTSAVMHYRTDGGKDIRITVYGGQDGQGGEGFTFEYQFEYRKLPEINAYANSYLTLEGRHRIEYLPVGASYVLVETRVPDGFAKAADIVIRVSGTADIQRIYVENKKSALIISKSAGDHQGELAGARLGLYRGNPTGAFAMEPEYLVAEWVTGTDGTYTDLDDINGRIPEGYRRGDLKPHSIKGLADGTYWLAEIKSPGYYTSFVPVCFEYRQEDEIRIIRVSDLPVTGEAQIKKTDTGGNLLPGAVFELTAYRKTDLQNPVLSRLFCAVDGTAHLTGLPVGEADEDGRIEPYLYRLTEKIPPDGFAVNPEIFRWQFAPDKNGTSFAAGESAVHAVTVTDQKTRVLIGKKDFDALGGKSESAFVEGAVLAVYEVLGRDAEDNLIYDEGNPRDSWTTGRGEAEHAIEGLTAGRSYLLKELKAPEGYHVMEPVLFNLSADGRKIAGISNRLATVTVNYITAADGQEGLDFLDLESIQSVTLKGRYAVKVIREETGPNAITEKTIYSDGTETATGRVTCTPRPGWRDGGLLPERQAREVELAVEFADGTRIASFHPTEGSTETTIHNNTAPENPKILMGNPGTGPGNAIDPRQAVLNTVTYANLSNEAADIELTVYLDPDTKLLDAGEGVENGRRLVFSRQGLRSLESGAFTFTTEVAGQSSCVSAVLKCNGKTVMTKKEVPVLCPDRLIIFNELTGSGKTLHAGEASEFEVRLYTGDGEELRGRYAYSGNGGQGRLGSGEHITLRGNQYICIDPEPYRDAYCTVTRIVDGKTACSKAEEAAVFTRAVTDTSERERFRKGESYVIREFTTFTDGTSLETNRLAFTLDEQASISKITALDRKTDVTVSKVDITGQDEIEGCRMSLEDESGNVLDFWVSDGFPHRIAGILAPGGCYILREENPAPGYAYAEEIRFTVNQEGIPDYVAMADDFTRIQIWKKDSSTKEPVQGAEFQVLDMEGAVLDTWVSGEQPHGLTGILTAGCDYVLRETRAPIGYERVGDLQFTVPRGAEILTLVCENARSPRKPEDDGPGSPPPPALTEPKEPERIGSITASYSPMGLQARGWLVLGPDGRYTVPLPKTGKAGKPLFFGWLALLSFLGICILKKKK